MSQTKHRQAVLLIHGIGEQRPMSTLRGFVNALVPVRTAFCSKPDDLSRSFELRRLVHENLRRNVQTCFFKYYWAYRLRDTKYQHLVGWAKRLLKIPPWRDEVRRFRWALFFVWVTVAVGGTLLSCYLLALLGVLQAGFDPLPWNKVLSLVPLALTVLSVLFSGFWLYWVGDAARYLNPDPANIAERHAIRSDAVAVLRGLHEARENGRPKYDRIVVVGHSLGSVIGYDALKFYWSEVNKAMRIVPESDADAKYFKVLDAGRALADGEGVGEGARFWKAQEALFGEIPPGGPWRVSDFVTLGSPLTHAGFLLAESFKDLKDRAKQRELPTCPPVEDKGGKGYAYEVKDEDDRVVGRTLHHAALFAFTKWTNLYFKGDLIGGPIGSRLGRGIRDVECDFAKRERLFPLLPWPKRSRCFWSHTQYWTRQLRPKSLGKLKKIILRWPAHEEVGRL